MTEKIIGILGGMGPEATIDLFTKIVKGTKVKKDQDHLRILIDNNPKIPDRTLAIQGKGPSPLRQLIQSAKLLEKAGADFIVIPCVTAHYYYAPLQGKVKIPILNIVTETVHHIKKRLKGVDKIGLIATTGTIQTGLFQEALSSIGIDSILLDTPLQENWVMEAIYGEKGIKTIGPSETSRYLILEVSQRLLRQGAQAILAGCTEIPLVLKEGELPVPVIDPISLLAQAAIAMARGRKR
ncbi:MAG: aspartate/glutamate racemase family protein [Deltaproteobacteria bacterium]|nr:aspartate/glutamate racemase family protein [Deltaproteobacteria bacterium]